MFPLCFKIRQNVTQYQLIFIYLYDRIIVKGGILMSRHSTSRKKEKKSRLVLYTFIVFLIVAAICAGVIFAVIFMPSSEQSLKAPTAPTPKPTEQVTANATKSPTPTPEATPAPTEESDTSTPVFSKVSASSTRDPYRTETGTVTYPPSNAFDNNKSTVWTPDPDEENPWIELSATTGQTVKGIEIINGYSKSKKLYEANSRAKDVIVECNGVRYSYTLQDKGAGKAQRLAFPEAVKSAKVRITISSVYEGSEYDDLCISEITPYNK